MILGWISIVHLAVAVLCVIELGLTAYLVSAFDGPWATAPSEINFMVFNSVWSLLVLAYVGLTPLYYDSIFHRLASLALLAVTTIFWFAGSIALAADFGGPYSCGGDSICGSMTAAITFGFFIWAVFTGLTVLDAIEAMRSRNRGPANNHAKPYVGA